MCPAAVSRCLRPLHSKGKSKMRTQERDRRSVSGRRKVAAGHDGAGAMSGAAMAIEEWRPRVNPWLIAAAVMLSTFMEVLDSTIVSVAQPNMAGALASTNDEASWVLTSYLVANAVVLPASGWFAVRFGRRNFLLACTALFTVMSVLCGLAPTMGFLVLARVLQGAAGGALQPLSQAILMESFPVSKRGIANAVFALGVVIAPVIGPVDGRVAHRSPVVALGVLHQRAVRGGVALHDDAVHRGSAVHTPGGERPDGWCRVRVSDAVAGEPPDRAGPGAAGRLVCEPLHSDGGDRIGGVVAAVSVARTDNRRTDCGPDDSEGPELRGWLHIDPAGRGGDVRQSDDPAVVPADAAGLHGGSGGDGDDAARDRGIAGQRADGLPGFEGGRQGIVRIGVRNFSAFRHCCWRD